jgi:hypothetical protein
MRPLRAVAVLAAAAAAAATPATATAPARLPPRDLNPATATAPAPAPAPAPARLLPPRDLSFSSLNSVAALRALPVPHDPRPDAPANGTTWAIEASCCGYGAFTPEAVAASSVAAGGLFDLPCGRPTLPVVAEWGYEFFNDVNNLFPVCGNLTASGYASPPVNRSDAAQRVAAYWLCRAAAARNATTTPPPPTTSPLANDAGGVFSMAGHYFFDSVAGAAGGLGVSGSEIGENINSINLHLAWTRGAARQFAVPFTLDFSAWFQGYILDYSPPPGFWGSASSPVGGHSLSLFKRAYYASFVSGAGSIIAEAGAVNFFAGNETGKDGGFPLSPLGQLGQDFYAFTHGGVPAPAIVDSETIRGLPYVPLALLLPATAGLGIGFFYQAKSWDVFPLSPAEERVAAVLADLWPARSFTVMSEDGTAVSESFYMAASAYGEGVDVLVDAGLATSPVLLAGNGAGVAYAALVFPGLGVEVDAALCTSLTAYILGGGAVWISADDVLAAPECWTPALTGVAALTPPDGPTLVAEVVDADTGETFSVTASSLTPRCATAGADGSGSAYIKVGGDPFNTTGWDGGVLDKCCRTDGTDCVWFPGLDLCAAALPLAPGLCKSCEALNTTLGCPAWSDLPPSTPIPAAVELAGVEGGLGAGARVVLAAAAGSGSSSPVLLANAAGAGVVLVSLTTDEAALGPGGFGLRAHILSRLAQDARPASILSITASWANASAAGGGGEGGQGGAQQPRAAAPPPVPQVHLNRQPSGWNVTLLNNYGIVKQPGSAPTIDASQTIRVAVVTAGGGTVDVVVGPGDVGFAFVEEA